MLSATLDHATLEVDKGNPYPLGANESTQGTNFAVYAKDPEKITLCFFDPSNLTEPNHEIPLDPTQNKTGDIWHINVKGLAPYAIYGYRITNKDQTHILLDPYAKALASDPKWHDTVNPQDVYRPLGKVLPNSTFDWENDTAPKIALKDLIIYEMHVRGFTKHLSSKTNHPGTYLGVIEKIPYLKQLGVNAVELMPVHEFNEEEMPRLNPATNKYLHNYFGYSTVNFFSPMNRFASNCEGDNALVEFKSMVKELHKNGIEVILDVVFNHTFEGNEKGPVISFKGFDPHAYYMINKDGAYLNFSGCGNTMNANHPVVVELILSALRYWVSEMHVDGFRFDLASILTRGEDGTPLANPPVIEAMTRDPMLSNIRLIAEAWDAAGLYQVGGFAPKCRRWGEWNGKFRDGVRKFIKGTPMQKHEFANAVCGSHDLYGNIDAPYSSINFVTAHDGFSLMDLVSYNDKHNQDNGEDNRDGTNSNESWNCGAEGVTTNKRVLALRRRQMRNFHLALMVSQGTPMLLIGDEYGHTRNGNNNTWCQDNELNWFLWDKLEENDGFHRFYKALIEFRKKHPLLGTESFLKNSVRWHGVNPDNAEWENDNRFLAFTLHQPDGAPDLYVGFNASHVELQVNLPNPGDGKAWYWVVNTHNPSPRDIYDEKHYRKVDKSPLAIPAYSAILLKAQ